MTAAAPSSSTSRRSVNPHQGFTPRSYQLPFMRYLDGGGKRAVWVVHRRGGKDLTALHQTCRMAFRRVGMYWHVFPTFAQGRKAIWEGFTSDGRRIIDMAFPRELVKARNESEMKIEFVNGSIWRLLGSDKIEVVGAGPVGVVFSEYALAKPTAWNMIRPMLRENEGWAAFITTPRGNNHAKKLYDVAGKEPRWFRELQTLYDTRAYDPDRTIAEERAEGMPEALIKQEYLCDWTAALVGSVWGDLVPDAASFAHPNDGVFTSWDLGFTDSTAIWFWRISGQAIDLIDHYESHGKPLSHYFDIIDGKPYQYVKHWLPHDAAARTLASGSSILNQCLDRYGSSKVAIGPKLSLLDGVQAGRWLLQKGCRFHERCAEGVEALKQYHYEYDEDRKTFGSKPEHDWSSHTADAFRYAAVVVRHSEVMTRKPEPPKPPVIGGLDALPGLDKLFEDEENARGERRRI